MKRCPQCNRVETDDALAFCRADGTALIADSGSISDDAGRARSGSGPVSSEIETSILPHTSTTPEINRATAPTTVLPSAQVQSRTSELSKPKRRRLTIALGVAIPVTVIAALTVGYFYFTRNRTTAIESIAVLPFQNKSSDADTDYLADGLAESLIYRLSQLPNLKVSPTSSVMHYKGKETDIAQVARELEVDAVMSGRLAQRGDDLTISVELIDSRTRKLLWAEQYDRKMSDLLATQREIATNIADKLQLKLSGTEARGITKKYTNSNEAYQFYLKGRYHYAKRTKDDLNKGIEYFQRAVKLDPNFALAYAWIADSYASMPAYPYLSPKEAFPKSQAAAKRALEIDPTLSEAHAAMAYSLALYDWNWTEAEREFKRAIDLDPKNSLAHVRFAICYYLPTGRMDQAIKEDELAVELEPLNLVNGANLVWMYMAAGRNADALAQGKKVYELEPDFILGRYLLGLTYNNNRMYREAIELAENTLQADPNNQLMLQVAGYAYARLGRRDDAKVIIARFKEISKTQYVISFFVATIYAGLGEKDNAFSELETGFKERDWRMSALLKMEPMIEPLRDDRRYKEMLKR